MTFQYHPMTEEECEREKAFALMRAGTYNFQVADAEYKTSSSGNPMIALKLKCWDDSGKEYPIFEYLVATSKMMWKTRHFCDSVGLTKEYEEGKFNEMLCIGKCGKAIVSIAAGNKKTDGTYYKDKNVVDDYVMTDKGSNKYHSPVEKDQQFKKDYNDEDVPF